MVGSLFEEFYDDVRPLTERDREILEEVPVDVEAVKANLGLSALTTDQEKTTLNACFVNLI